MGSYIFYGAWDERFLTLIIISTATDYISGLGASGMAISKKALLHSILYLLVGSLLSLGFTITTSWPYLVCTVFLAVIIWGLVRFTNDLEQAKRRKIFVLFSLTANLGLLAIFKYFNFFAESLVSLAQNFGSEVDYVTLNIILPVGISFYTFQTLSYTIDAYRGKIPATGKLLELAAFVSFFPQLVAGPVERARNLLPQFNKRREITLTNIKTGLVLFAWGMYKKVYIADNLAPIADAAFLNSSSHSPEELLIGLLAFTFQIYCDFSGYSDMARGLARMLGFNLMLNFNIPYISRTPSEFWQRWHISLSSWLRDYLYISLGGNRNGNYKTYRNLGLTMVLGGLWHGASWTFIIWGAFHGAILIIYRFFKIDDIIISSSNASPIKKLGTNTVSIAMMFTLTVVGWLIFRANTMEVLMAYLSGLTEFSMPMLENWTQIIILVSPLLLMQAYQTYSNQLEIFWKLPTFVRLNVALYIMFCIFFLQPSEPAAFIYFDF